MKTKSNSVQNLKRKVAVHSSHFPAQNFHIIFVNACVWFAWISVKIPYQISNIINKIKIVGKNCFVLVAQPGDILLIIFDEWRLKNGNARNRLCKLCGFWNVIPLITHFYCTRKMCIEITDQRICVCVCFDAPHDYDDDDAFKHKYTHARTHKQYEQQ